MRLSSFHKRSGFSLIEAAIASTILAALMATTFAVMHTGSETVRNGETAASVQSQALACIDHMLSGMPEARITNMQIDGDGVQFMQPVFSGDPAYDFDPALDVTWGSESNPDGGTIAFRFIVDKVLDEYALEADLNRDGDMADRFDLGHMARVDTFTGGRTPISGSMFIVVSGNHAGDINGDGTPDRIFTKVDLVTGDQLVVNLWAMRQDHNGRPYLLRVKSRVSLRNPE